MPCTQRLAEKKGKTASADTIHAQIGWLERSCMDAFVCLQMDFVCLHLKIFCLHLCVDVVTVKSCQTRKWNAPEYFVKLATLERQVRCKHTRQKGKKKLIREFIGYNFFTLDSYLLYSLTLLIMMTQQKTYNCTFDSQ